MAVLAQYSSGNESYAQSANAFLSGMSQGQSLMERKQRMQIEQQQENRQQMEFYAKLPLLQANATLTQVSAQAAIDAATERTQFETRAAAQSVIANKEFQDAISYNVTNEDGYDGGASDGTPEGDTAQAEASKNALNRTLEIRAQKLAALRVKYGYMKGLPEYNAFYETVTKASDNAYIDVAKDLKLDQLMAAARINADQRRYGNDKTFEGVQLKTQSSRDVAGINADSRQSVATTQAESRRDSEIAKAQKRYEFESTINLRDEAIRSGNHDLADEYQARLNKMNSSSSVTVERPTPKSVPVKPSPNSDRPPFAISVNIPGSGIPASNNGNSSVAADNQTAGAVTPKRVDPKATYIEIGGKNYPIYKDKNGKRAYKVDGHYVPLDTE